MHKNASKKKSIPHQDISDALKRELLKNTNIRHIGRVTEPIGRTPGQDAAVSFIFLAHKKAWQIYQKYK